MMALSFGLVTLLSATLAAQGTTSLVEVDVTRVLLPAHGFDDNDSVELTVDGMLPNGCYQIDGQKVERDEQAKTLTVHQFASKKLDGACVNEASLPDQMTFPRPYTLDVRVGQLASGDYRILYFTNGLTRQNERAFNVAVATEPAIDALPYAHVSNVQVRDVIRTGTRVQALLSGTLLNSCMHLYEDVRVRRDGDVLVIQPTVRVDPGMCLQYIRPYEKLVDLGRLPEGRYLAHVRSMNGKAVTHVFSVVTRAQHRR